MRFKPWLYVLFITRGGCRHSIVVILGVIFAWLFEAVAGVLVVFMVLSSQLITPPAENPPPAPDWAGPCHGCRRGSDYGHSCLQHCSLYSCSARKERLSCHPLSGRCLIFSAPTKASMHRAREAAPSYAFQSHHVCHHEENLHSDGHPFLPRRDFAWQRQKQCRRHSTAWPVGVRTKMLNTSTLLRERVNVHTCMNVCMHGACCGWAGGSGWVRASLGGWIPCLATSFRARQKEWGWAW